MYKCFSCGCVGTIVNITESLSGCKPHEAINFIKEVYGIVLEESDWTKEHKEILINSVNYLSSEEFSYSFPAMSHIIRNRKHYLQMLSATQNAKK